MNERTQINCPECGLVGRIDLKHIGKQIRCKSCGHQFSWPDEHRPKSGDSASARSHRPGQPQTGLGRAVAPSAAQPASLKAEADDYLRGARERAKSVVRPAARPGWVDTRSPLALALEMDAQHGTSMGPALDTLVRDLIVGHGGETRAREIGAILNTHGGIHLMRAAHSRVAVAKGGRAASELERWWDGIGDWCA